MCIYDLFQLSIDHQVIVPSQDHVINYISVHMSIEIYGQVQLPC
jgi:hypothetical protein